MSKITLLEIQELFPCAVCLVNEILPLHKIYYQMLNLLKKAIRLYPQLSPYAAYRWVQQHVAHRSSFMMPAQCTWPMAALCYPAPGYKQLGGNVHSNIYPKAISTQLQAVLAQNSLLLAMLGRHFSKLFISLSIQLPASLQQQPRCSLVSTLLPTRSQSVSHILLNNSTNNVVKEIINY